jgi:hypothetical protein
MVRVRTVRTVRILPFVRIASKEQSFFESFPFQREWLTTISDTFIPSTHRVIFFYLLTMVLKNLLLLLALAFSSEAFLVKSATSIQVRGVLFTFVPWTGIHPRAVSVRDQSLSILLAKS